MKNSRKPFGFILIVLSMLTGLPLSLRGSQKQPAISLPQVTFTDTIKEAGISFVNVSSPHKKYIVESMGGGVAFFDFDNDGRLDIYLLNSYTVEAALAKRARPPAALYRNLGNNRFEDVAIKARVADPGWAMGVSVADYDNDGDDDLYVTCFGPNRLYRNQGDGRFEDVTAQAGVGDTRFSTGSAWGDYDLDGDLDLFVTNYVDFKLDDLPQFGKGKLCQYRGVPVQCGPRGLPGAGDALYRNNADGTFTDVSKAAKVDDASGHYGLGVMWTDLNDDGWPDVVVANDATPNYAYRNNRDGTFTEEGFLLGIAVDENGTELGNMGLTVGDYDRDGRLDLVTTTFADQYNLFLRQNTDGNFADVSRQTRTADVSLPYVGWGTKLFDYDNDGWLDLLVVNGHVYPQIEGAFPGGTYRQRKLLYRNLRDGTFAEIASSTGAALMEDRASRGAAFGDYDEDGDTDVVVNELDGPPSLLRNDGGAKAGHWIKLRLIGTKSNRNAVGAKVSLTAGRLTQVDEVRSGDSYISHSDRRLHFGLGTATTVETVTIRWPSGAVEKLAKLPVDRVVTIIEGKNRNSGQ
ncbi:MAG: CRTAC1 family protein [Pyrinomonadaceae bacterium]|nr:CRTAC1 family protein [Pyrinomonadaceae bacterium]